MNNDSPLKQLWHYAESERKNVIIASTYSVINKFFDIFPEILLGIAIDVVARGDKSFVSHLGFESTKAQLVFLAVVTFLIFAFESFFQFLYSVKWRNIAQSIQHNLRIDSYSHVQSLDMQYFENQHSGYLMSILNDDVNQLERFLDNGATSLIHLVTTVILVSIYFFSIAPSVAIFSMIPIPIILWGGYYFQSLLGPKYQKVRASVGDLNSRLSSNLSGISSIKSYTSEDQESKIIEDESNKYLKNNQEAIKYSSAFIPVIRIAIVIGFMSTMILGGFRVIDGNLNAGLYASLLFLTQRLLWPFTSLAQTVDLYQRAMASTRRIFSLLDEQPKIANSPKAVDDHKFSGKIQFQKVDFAYLKDQPILKSISFDIEPGQSIGVVGSTGSGKSTLIKLLLRFYDKQSGDIMIDQKKIEELNLKNLRENIAYVSQEVFLTNATIAENIMFNQTNNENEPYPQDAIIEAAKKSESFDFIEQLPDGFDTIVGERGQKLSGGQRQRISLARAFLKNAPIVILDEATAAVDNETEAAIQRSLDKYTKETTTIIVAHRLSTIRHCDQILVLSKGELVQSGTHRELIEQGGEYQKLWKVQTGERF